MDNEINFGEYHPDNARADRMEVCDYAFKFSAVKGHLDIVDALVREVPVANNAEELPVIGADAAEH